MRYNMKRILSIGLASLSMACASVKAPETADPAAEFAARLVVARALVGATSLELVAALGEAKTNPDGCHIPVQVDGQDASVNGTVYFYETEKTNMAFCVYQDRVIAFLESYTTGNVGALLANGTFTLMNQELAQKLADKVRAESKQ